MSGPLHVNTAECFVASYHRRCLSGTCVPLCAAMCSGMTVTTRDGKFMITMSDKKINK